MKGADILKFMMALVVVWIHTGDSELWGLVNWAVPVFFVLSGFFLWGKIFKADNSEKQETAITAWLGKSLRLYIIWTLIFLPFAVIGFARDGVPFLKAAVVWARNVVFVGENYLSWPLWYLLGMLWAGVIIFLSIKLRIPFWLLCLVAAALYVTPRFIDMETVPGYTAIFKTTRNGIFIGLPFMMLGGLVRRLCPSITGWSKASRWYRPSLCLRFFSVHIYLTHMLVAGAMILAYGPEKGFRFWGITVLMALVSGAVIWFLPKVQSALYGRAYSN